MYDKHKYDKTSVFCLHTHTVHVQWKDTSVFRTLSRASEVALVYKTTSEMRTPL